MGKFIALKKYYRIEEACISVVKNQGLENKKGPSEKISTQISSSQSNEETVNGNGKQTEPLLNSNISVSEAIQKPSFRRQASASTFLCPDYIPGMLYIYICLKVIYPKYNKYIPVMLLVGGQGGL